MTKNVKKPSIKKKPKIIMTGTSNHEREADDADKDDTLTDEDKLDQENKELMRLLSKPEELSDIVETFTEEDGVVTVCPTCRVEGYFVDNTCPNCGAKKRTKTGLENAHDIDEDVFSKADDYYVNPDDE